MVNGLPEAAVEDLSLYDHDGLTLLRAGIASRGVWELRLDREEVEDRTYLRVHDDDLRYRARANMTSRTGSGERSWFGSPDIQVRTPAGPLAFPLPAGDYWDKDVQFEGPRRQLLRRFQSAMRARGLRASPPDGRVVPTGVWDTYFNELLREVPGAELRLTGEVRLTKAVWDSVMVAPDDSVEPWSGPGPTEADLHDLTELDSEGTAGQTDHRVQAQKLAVDIVVHHRGLQPRDGADVRVVLLRWIADRAVRPRPRSNTPDRWAPTEVPWAAAVNEVLGSADGTTTEEFFDGWEFVPADPDADVIRHTLTGTTLDNGTTGVVTFDLDLTGERYGTVILLAAVIWPGFDTNLEEEFLEELVLTRPEVAARALRIG